MEPQIKKEQEPSQDIEEKKSWLTPDIQVFDLKEATKSSIFSSGDDGLFNYS